MTRRAALAVLSLLLLAGCGDDSAQLPPGGTPSASSPAVTTSAPATATLSASPTSDDRIRVVVAGGKVVSRPGERIPVKLGERVRIEVEADVTDEVHVHAYDIKADVAPGRPARLEFEASIPGVIEVELEKGHLLLFKLEVRP